MNYIFGNLNEISKYNNYSKEKINNEVNNIVSKLDANYSVVKDNYNSDTRLHCYIDGDATISIDFCPFKIDGTKYLLIKSKDIMPEYAVIYKMVHDKNSSDSATYLEALSVENVIHTYIMPTSIRFHLNQCANVTETLNDILKLIYAVGTFIEL